MDKKKFTGWSWRHAALVGLLFSASTVTAQPDYRPLYLDWIGGAGSAPNLTCQETWRSGCIPSGNSYVYWPPPADDFASAVARATRDFIPMSGHSRVDRWGGTLRCEAASVTLAPPHTVSYWRPVSPWSASVTFTQQCTYTDQWGRASAPGPVQTNYSMYGECEPGFARTGGFLTTGECYRPNGGPCVKYPENTTTGCNKAAADLYATLPPPNDVRRTFHETLACGIRTACAARCQMDNCSWLEHVSPASTGPYLRNEVPWPQKIAECNNLPALLGPGRSAACGWILAAQNIEVDLTEALVAYGCGTQRDWDLIFEVNFSVKSTCVLPSGAPMVRRAASEYMRQWRKQLREVCFSRRNAAGLDPFINDELRGQTCGR